MVRYIVIVACVLSVGQVKAQPGAPDITFTLVEDDKGRPMQGVHAEDMITRHDLGRSGVESWSVEEHFTSMSPYATPRNGEHISWIDKGIPIAMPGKARVQFRFMDCFCKEHFIMVYKGSEKMRMDLPDAAADRWALVQHVMARSGDLPSPEVIRFRPGRHTYEEVMNDTVFDALEARIAKRLKDDANAFYKKQITELEEYYRNLPPPAPATVPYIPPPSMTPEQWEGDMAGQPGLEKVEVDRMNADTVRVRMTGRVMLDGGCASGMPLFGIEMRTDSGWVERVPLERTRMDCGMPWADWDQHVVQLPSLRWWVRINHQGRRKCCRAHIGWSSRVATEDRCGRMGSSWINERRYRTIARSGLPEVLSPHPGHCPNDFSNSPISAKELGSKVSFGLALGAIGCMHTWARPSITA